MRFPKRLVLAGLVTAVFVVISGVAEAANELTTAREIVNKAGSAVVTVQMVLKVGMPFGQGQKEEVKTEATGTVIDASGLTVLSLSATNPMGSIVAILGEVDAEGSGATSEVSDAKIRTSDGKEIPAKIVLRDKDLDLAFIRPINKPTVPMPFVDLSASAKPEVLDQVLVLNRMGKVANRALSVLLGRVQAVVEKPRRFYVIGVAGSGGLGGPVLSEDGKAIGIMLMRSTPVTDTADISAVLSLLDGKSSGNSASIPAVVSAEDIVAVAAQAPEDAPKEPEKKATTETKKPTKPQTPATGKTQRK